MKKGFVRKWSVRAVTFLVLAAVAVIAVSVFSKSSESEEIEVPVVTLQNSINNIGQLATAEYSYTKVGTANKPAKKIIGFSIPLTESKVLFSYNGSIKVGIDFEKIAVEENELEKTIDVTMPEVIMISSDLDQDSIVVYDEDASPFNMFSIEDLNASQIEMKNSAEQDAQENGLYERAEENAKDLIFTMISNMYDTNEYTINFK